MSGFGDNHTGIYFTWNLILLTQNYFPITVPYLDITCPVTAVDYFAYFTAFADFGIITVVGSLHMSLLFLWRWYCCIFCIYYCVFGLFVVDDVSALDSVYDFDIVWASVDDIFVCMPVTDLIIFLF